MSASIEELRKEKERIEKEAAEVERKLQEAVRLERETEAAKLLPQLFELTARIDALKEERQQLLYRARESAPRLGDFTYASEDYRLTLQSARAGLKQPELFDRLVAALAAANLHVEPRAPRYRLFRGLQPVGTLHISPRRISITASDAILDGALIDAAKELDSRFPGLAVVELASSKKERRVREGVPQRLPNGDFATSMTFHATDTGTLDAILPLALQAIDHVAALRERVTPDDEARLFEPWPVDTASAA